MGIESNECSRKTGFVRQWYLVSNSALVVSWIRTSKKGDLLSLSNYRPKIKERTWKGHQTCYSTEAIATRNYRGFCNYEVLCMQQLSRASPASQQLHRLHTPQEAEHHLAVVQTHEWSSLFDPDEHFSPPLLWTAPGKVTSGSCTCNVKSSASSFNMLPHQLCLQFPCLICHTLLTLISKKFKGAHQQALVTAANRSQLPSRNQELNSLTLKVFVSEEWQNSEAGSQSSRLSKHRVWFLSCWLHGVVWIHLPDKSHSIYNSNQARSQWHLVAPAATLLTALYTAALGSGTLIISWAILSHRASHRSRIWLQV